MPQDNFVSALHKVSDFGFKTGTFKGDDGREIDYTTLVVRFVVDGKIEELSLSGQNPIKPALLRTVLRSADDQKKQGSFLDDKDEKNETI